MPPKTLKWWAREWDKACALACLYGCTLDLDQFCASRGLESEERDELTIHFLTTGVLQ